MGREIEPDRTVRVDVGPGEVVACDFAAGEDVIPLLNGGPGLPCDYLRDSHSCLIDDGYRVVAFEQLGTGKSDRLIDPAL